MFGCAGSRECNLEETWVGALIGGVALVGSGLGRWGRFRLPGLFGYLFAEWVGC